MCIRDRFCRAITHGGWQRANDSSNTTEQTREKVHKRIAWVALLILMAVRHVQRTGAAGQRFSAPSLLTCESDVSAPHSSRRIDQMALDVSRHGQMDHCGRLKHRSHLELLPVNNMLWKQCTSN